MIERHVDLNHLALTRNMAYVYVLSQWIDLLGLGNLSALQQGVQRVPNKSSACHDSDKAAQAKSDANANVTFFSRPVFLFVSFHMHPSFSLDSHQTTKQARDTKMSEPDD